MWRGLRMGMALVQNAPLMNCNIEIVLAKVQHKIRFSLNINKIVPQIPTHHLRTKKLIVFLELTFHSQPHIETCIHIHHTNTLYIIHYTLYTKSVYRCQIINVLKILNPFCGIFTKKKKAKQNERKMNQISNHPTN